MLQFYVLILQSTLPFIFALKYVTDYHYHKIYCFGHVMYLIFTLENETSKKISNRIISISDYLRVG